jgi:hypothetical protein
MKASNMPNARPLTSTIAPLTSSLGHRLTAEFREMPGLRLTTQQAARLIGVDIETASSVLAALVERGLLRVTATGYVRV